MREARAHSCASDSLAVPAPLARLCIPRDSVVSAVVLKINWALSTYFSTLSSVPLNDNICPAPAPPRLDRRSFAVGFVVWERESATLALFQDCLGCFGCFHFHMNFKVKLSLCFAHTMTVGVRGGEGCVFLGHSPPYFFETVSR